MTVAKTTAKPARDRAFWTAVRAAYAAGVSVERTCALFGIGRSTLMAKAREEGWLRRDVVRAAEQALVASIATEVSGAEESLRLADAPARIAPPDAASVAASALAAARAAIRRAVEANSRADDGAADVAIKLGERFAKAAAVLSTLAASDQDDPQARRDELLRRIDRVLEGARTARRVEVAELQARGVDPREAWIWDAEDGDWVWDPGGAAARATESSAARDPS